MAQFSYDSYVKAVDAAQNKGSGVRVGWFKLSDDGDEALVRINLTGTNDLQFATIHQLGANTKWMKVSCTNEFGSFNGTCPLCKAAANNTSIGKASKRVYIPMLVSYKDRATGQWSVAQPVIWDKPAGFSREIANIIRDYGDLRGTLFKITRNGAKGDLKTTYSLMPAPPVFKQEMIAQDFSAFDNFRLDKHSFWVKTEAEINTFLTTGAFPEVSTNNAPSNAQIAEAYAAAPQNSVPMQNVAPVAQTKPVNDAPFDVGTPQNVAPATQPATSNSQFSGFTF